MYKSYPGSAQMPEVQRPAPPASVRNAAWLMYAGAAASLIYAVVFIATLSATKNAIAAHSPGLTASQLSTQQHVLLAGAIISGLIQVGLWIFIARNCLRGRGWARITGTVFFGLATPDLLGGLALPQAGLDKVFALLIWLIGLATVVALWRGTSSAFFRASSGPR